MYFVHWGGGGVGPLGFWRAHPDISTHPLNSKRQIYSTLRPTMLVKNLQSKYRDLSVFWFMNSDNRDELDAFITANRFYTVVYALEWENEDAKEKEMEKDVKKEVVKEVNFSHTTSFRGSGTPLFERCFQQKGGSGAKRFPRQNEIGRERRYSRESASHSSRLTRWIKIHHLEGHA